MTAHESYEELAAGYALDALEPGDEQQFLRHLVGCARCERALDAHRATAATLADGAAPVQVPDGLFAALRAAVVAESGERVFAAGSPAPVALDARRLRRRPSPAALLAAAAAVLVTVLGASNLALRQDRVEQTDASRRLNEAVRTLDEGPGRHVPLLDPERKVAAVAVLQGDHVSLVVEGLAANDPGTTYVFWERGRFGGVLALATFDVRRRGVEVVRDLPLQHGSEGPAAFAVTREKGDVAPARPLTPPLALGQVEQA